MQIQLLWVFFRLVAGCEARQRGRGGEVIKDKKKMGLDFTTVSLSINLIPRKGEGGEDGRENGEEEGEKAVSSVCLDVSWCLVVQAYFYCTQNLLRSILKYSVLLCN